MRIFHIAVVVRDLDESAQFYQEVFGFRPLGERRPGNYPGDAFDLTDGEVHFSLLHATGDDMVHSSWSKGNFGPNHVGIQVDDVPGTRAKAEAHGSRIFGERFASDDSTVLTYFKCVDPNGAEIDVSSRPFDLSPASA